MTNRAVSGRMILVWISRSRRCARPYRWRSLGTWLLPLCKTSSFNWILSGSSIRLEIGLYSECVEQLQWRPNVCKTNGWYFTLGLLTCCELIRVELRTNIGNIPKISAWLDSIKGMHYPDKNYAWFNTFDRHCIGGIKNDKSRKEENKLTQTVHLLPWRGSPTWWWWQSRRRQSERRPWLGPRRPGRSRHPSRTPRCPAAPRSTLAAFPRTDSLPKGGFIVKKIQF